MFTKIKNYFPSIQNNLKQLRNSFSTKLTTLFLTALIIPLLLVSSILYKISSNTYSERLIQAIQLTSRQVAQQLDERLTQIRRVSSMLEDYMLTFPNYLYNLEYKTPPDFIEQLDAFSALRINIFSLQSSFDLKNISIFINDNSFFSNEGLTFFGFNELQKFNIPEDYLNQATEKLIWSYIPEQKYPFFTHKQNEPTQAILCMRALISESEQVLNYAYFISIDVAEFEELISTAYTDTDVNGYLINECGQVICSSETIDSADFRESFSMEELDLLKENNEYNKANVI